MGLIVSEINKRWPGNCIPFVLDPALSTTVRGKISNAMAAWEAAASVHFISRTTQDRYVKFDPDWVPTDGICSSSTMGMAGGEQQIHLDPSSTKGQVIHEIGHALGFYHEHKRRDRDQFIDIDLDAIIPEYRSQFTKVQQGEGIMVGNYDLDSIMHYGPAPSLAIDGKNPIITTDRAVDAGRIGQRSGLSSNDTSAGLFMNTGNAHVYQLSHHGQIETVVQQSQWSLSGWTIAVPYTIGGHNFLLRIKGSSGKMRVNRLDLAGTVGEQIQKKTWTTGWTLAVKFAVTGSNYLMVYKRTSGKILIRKILAGGEIGDEIVSGFLESGYTYAAAYSILAANFMVFSKRGTGEVHIFEITWDGKIGQQRFAHDYSRKWNITHPYSVLQDAFLFMLETSSGVVSIRRLTFDGKVGSQVQSKNWSSGWTFGIPYSVGTSKFLFLLKKDTGDLAIERIESDGKIGPETDQRKISAGWELAKVYNVGTASYVLLIKS